MAGNDPLVAEYNARDSAKGGVHLWRDVEVGVYDFRNSSGLILTGATTPIISIASGQAFVRWAAGVANLLTFSVTLPGDYNEVQDKCHVLLPVLTSTTGDTTVVMTGGSAYARSAAALAAPITAPTATITDGATVQVLDLNFSGIGYKGKDALTFTLTPAAHATTVIDLFGAIVRYSGGLSLYSETDRYAIT